MEVAENTDLISLKITESEIPEKNCALSLSIGKLLSLA